MKSVFTLLLAIFSVALFGQGPVIEGTYLPVRNTKILQVWDTTPGTLHVPIMGANQTWDYSFTNNQFLNIVDTFPITLVDPASTAYGQYFPDATHAGFIRAPFNHLIADSNYWYYEINSNGMFQVGSFNTSVLIDSSLIYLNKELYAPETITYNDVLYDTAIYLGHAKNLFGYKARVKGYKTKHTTYAAYGTLKLPYGTFNNVAVLREVRSSIDSIYVDLFNTNNYTFLVKETGSSIGYQFVRNNTFGSTFLMYLHTNPQNTNVEWGWFNLPVDIGSISGTVYTNASETTPVTNGEMYLYREHSNFTKNDILARTPVDINGNFKFDSIPYGEYRIAVRPNTSIYNNAMITYVGDTTDWLGATNIITTSSVSAGHKIHLQYHPSPNGNNGMTGQLVFNPFVQKSAGITSSKPVPGIGIVIKKNPGASSERNIISDNNGEFHLGNLDDGSYRIFVDIPGLHMSGTYEFTVSNGSLVNNLDFTVGTDSIHPFSSPIGVKELTKKEYVDLKAYPNPYKGNTTVYFALKSSQHVSLEVFNMLGQRVQILDQGPKNFGIYNYTFSAKNLGHPAGIYFVKLTAGNSSRVIKVIEE